MFCAKCENELSQCTCPDLKERLERLKASPFLVIAPEKMEAYERQAKLNDGQKELSE